MAVRAAGSAMPFKLLLAVPDRAATAGPLILECSSPEGQLRLFSSSRLTRAPREPITGGYLLVRSGQSHEGTFSGEHNTGYGVAVRATLEQDRVTLVADVNRGYGIARFWGESGELVVPGFDQCGGAALQR
jgi:hypothetical protein